MKTLQALSAILMLALGISIGFSQQGEEEEQPQLSPFEELGELRGPFSPTISQSPTAREDIIVYLSNNNQAELSIATSPTVPGLIMIGSWTSPSPGPRVGYYYSTNSLTVTTLVVSMKARSS